MSLRPRLVIPLRAATGALMLLLSACGPQPADGGDVDSDAGEPGDAAVALAPDASESTSPDASFDASLDASGPADAGVPHSPLYAPDRTHSPVNAAVTEELRRIAARGPSLDEAVFMKVGDSNTVSVGYLHCFAGANVDLDGRSALQPTLDHFRAGKAGTTTPFDRTSKSATIGWSAWSALSGTPPPIQQEHDAVHPRYGVVMFGTNDVEAMNLERFASNMFDIADFLIGRGTVPVFFSIPRRDDDPARDAWVPRYNAVTRGVAQARRVPFVDLHRALDTLASHGLGPDGIHLDTYSTNAGVRGCVLTSAGLQHGQNVRNLLTLEALTRTKAALDSGSAPEPDAPGLAGAGTKEAPFEIPALPFADWRSTADAGPSRIDRYTGCGATQDESGPEWIYRLKLDKPATIRAMVFSRGGSDVDVHIVDASGTGAGCVVRDDKVAVAALQAGTWLLSLDSYVPAAGAAKAGEYLLAVVKE